MTQADKLILNVRLCATMYGVASNSPSEYGSMLSSVKAMLRKQIDAQ